MSSNTPTLMQSEEKEAPWNQEEKEITVEATVSITMSKTVKLTISKGDEDDDRKLMSDFDTQYYSPEQMKAFLEEYKKRKNIKNIQAKINDLSDWVVDEKCITLE